MSISGGTLTGLIQDKERLLIQIYNAEVAELVDAHDSGSCEGNLVEVRVFSSAPFSTGGVKVVMLLHNRY